MLKQAQLRDVIRGFGEVKLRNVERFWSEARALGYSRYDGKERDQAQVGRISRTYPYTPIIHFPRSLITQVANNSMSSRCLWLAFDLSFVEFTIEFA